MDNSKQIENLVSKIISNEILYRNGVPSISDNEFDNLISELKNIDPTNPVLFHIKGENFLGKLVPLPYPMGSIENVKTDEAFHKWLRKVSGEIDHWFVVMPKLDGISCTRTKDRVFISRGDGAEQGTDITKYCIFFDKMKSSVDFDCRGEIVVSRENFKFINDIRVMNGLDAYKSERSAVVGLMQSETPDVKCLSLLEFIPYTIFDADLSKAEQLEVLSEFSNSTKIDFKIISFSSLLGNTDDIKRLFYKWSEKYEIDGLVVEVNFHQTRSELGFETNTFNPKYARAYKVGFEEEKSTTVTNIVQQIGKNGSYTPVIQIEPVVLCGNTITNINGDNERFLLYYGIGVGTSVTLKKSGNVIPRLTKVEGRNILDFSDFNKWIKDNGYRPEEFQRMHGLIDSYLAPSFSFVWDDNRVNIRIPQGTKSDSQEKKKILFFFSSLGILNIGESIVSTFYELGYDTVDKILNLKESDLLEIDNFGKKKAFNFIQETDKRLSMASLEQIMSASNLFEKVGETKLKSLGFSEEDRKIPSIDDVTKINGIGSVIAETIVNNIQEFWEFYDKIKHRIKVSEKKKEGIFLNEIICFTGFRDKLMVETILENGGEYKESISKAITLLVYDDSTSVEKSGKVKKAEKDGIRLETRKEFAKKIEELKFKQGVNNMNTSFGSLL